MTCTQLVYLLNLLNLWCPCYIFISDIPSSVYRISVSPSSQVTGNTLLTLSCEVDSYPASRLRLYRQGTAAPVKNVNANALEYKVTVDNGDNGAQFYCRADDNNKHTGWEFDVESGKLRINVLCK